MAKKKALTDERKELIEYRPLWESIQRDLDSIIGEIEMTTSQQVSKKVPRDVVFDSVPILRNLKAARKHTDELLFLYPRG
ncbi:hypothetical protein HOH87_02455 [bacterium]|jgi:hypothetical protein|nr:hypothetical protein [bacterium]